jgi:hypothetical protein
LRRLSYCGNKKMRPKKGAFLSEIKLLLAEAVAAVNGTIVAGLERNLAFASAFSAHSIIHLSCTAASAGNLAGVAALFAALRLIRESFFGEKLLFTGGKHEFAATVFAIESLVLEH